MTWICFDAQYECQAVGQKEVFMCAPGELLYLE